MALPANKKILSRLSIPLLLSGVILIIFYATLARLNFLFAFWLFPAFLFLGGIYSANKISKKKYYLSSELEDLQGRINIAYQQLKIEESRSQALRFKLKRYDGLALLTEKFNKNLSLEDALKILADESFFLLGGALQDIVCLVYLCDDSCRELSLSAQKDNFPSPQIIKPKGGDIFDQWALKHTQPLLVEDTSRDFRFDPLKLKEGLSGRKVGSLISCCLMSRNRPLGILRLDSLLSGQFSLEDLRLLAVISDIASVAIDNAKHYQRIKELAIQDSLTGLYTRKFVSERLEEEVNRSLLTGGDLSLIMLDIDYFKRYNDLYGHLAGDIVLKNLSLWLRESLRDEDALIGRLGGEEFLIILPSCAKDRAFSLAENARGFIQEKRISLRRKVTGITVSCGIANCPQDAKGPQELLNKADMALYEAKRLGRNRVCLF